MTIAIAHRGDPIAARENTLAAFDAAVREGADMVELDLHRTRDGAIAVVHDPTLSRLWGTDRAVADLDRAELGEIGSGAERIPLLPQVLDHVNIPLMIDFTGSEVVAGALEAVQRAGAMERSLFVTGDIGALRMLRALSPVARIGLTWIEPEPPHPALLHELGAEFWNPMFRLAKPEHVAAVHDLGLKVSTWTVDEPRHMARVAAAAVDAIVSNRIGDLREFLSRRAS